MDFEVIAYTLTTSVEYNGVCLDLYYGTGIHVPARAGTISCIGITVIKQGEKMKNRLPRIETPITKDGLQPVLVALEGFMEENDALALLEKLITALRGLDGSTFDVRPEIFSDLMKAG